MTKIDTLGTRIPSVDLLGLFEAEEGAINLYYGGFGSGKTYGATADVFSDLMNGSVVYVNWDIKYDGFDERKSFRHVFWKTLFFKDVFYKFPKDNLKRYKISDDWARMQEKADGSFYRDFWEWFRSRTDCVVYADEGYVLLDSYRGIKVSLEDRVSVLSTRHINRTINIVSQRPEAVHVSARGNVNRFYKFEKKMKWPLIFKRTEFQALKNDTVDEDPEKIVSVKTYFARKYILDAYDSRYLRAGIPVSQKVQFEASRLTTVEKLLALIAIFIPSLLDRVQGIPEPSEGATEGHLPRGRRRLWKLRR